MWTPPPIWSPPPGTGWAAVPAGCGRSVLPCRVCRAQSPSSTRTLRPGRCCSTTGGGNGSRPRPSPPPGCGCCGWGSACRWSTPRTARFSGSPCRPCAATDPGRSSSPGPDQGESRQNGGMDGPLLPDGRLLNRELSWLDFNARVLALAEDPRTPLLERVKFLAIFASNLDEFYMVRIAGLSRRASTGLPVRGQDRLPAREQLEVVAARTAELVARHARCFQEEIQPQLAK